MRVGKQTTDGLNPLRNIEYTLDLSQRYNNLLQITGDTDSQSFTWDSGVVGASGDTGDRFYLRDELGSPLRFTAADGTLVDSYAYDEFGGDLTKNQGISQPFGYTGYQYDNLARTYFAQAREYEPGAGRFVSEDPAHSDGNWYAYCGGNPIGFVDPLGLSFEMVGFGGFLDTNKYYQWLQLPSWNYIHREVQLDIWKRYDGAVWQTELYLPGFGRADLYMPSTEEIWEVKPASYQAGSKLQKGLDQLQRYVSADEKYKIGGATSITGNTFSTLNGKFTVTYENMGNGLVVYNFEKNPEKEPVPITAGDPATKPAEEKRTMEIQVYEPRPVPGWAWVAAGLIIVGTLVEDALSGGVGTLDDPASFAAAAALVGLAH